MLFLLTEIHTKYIQFVSVFSSFLSFFLILVYKLKNLRNEDTKNYTQTKQLLLFLLNYTTDRNKLPITSKVLGKFVLILFHLIYLHSPF